jgi:predicted TIM-barrel enzyme
MFDDGPNVYEEHRELIIEQSRSIAKAHQHTLFLISGGPIAKIMISEMWDASKCNQYVDMGSSLDFYTKEKEFPKKIKTETYNFKRWKYIKEKNYFETKDNVPNAPIVINSKK